MSVKRWKETESWGFTEWDCMAVMEECADGEYVLHSDYAALQAKVERLTKARDEALDAVKKGRVVTPTQRGDRGWQANKTHCKHGHPLTPDNIRVRSDGRRQCKACQRAHVAKHDQKRRAVPTTGSR